MSGTVDLPQHLLEDLRAQAELRGLTLADLVAQLADELNATASADADTGGPEILSFIGIGASDSGRTVAQSHDMLGEGFGRPTDHRSEPERE